ncbi:MAG: MCE family protein [Chitinivibrionales bacterium]|nr:MCE family protein [Chitinivibrionales bacterium]
MRKTNTELIVGAVIFLSIFILIAGVLWLKETSISKKNVQYTVVFPNIGSLQIGDPVRVNGVKRGSVNRISLYHSSVAVVINLHNDVILTDSSTITVQNVGLMGERMIGIQLSEKGRKRTPDTKTAVTYINGTFDTGIAEAMGMLGSVLQEALQLIDTVEEIVHQTIGDPRFITTFSTMVDRIDTMTVAMETVINNNKYDIRSSVKNIASVSATLKAFLAHNTDRLDKIIVNSKDLSTQALAVTTRIDSLSRMLNTMMIDIDHGKGSLGMLMKDEAMVSNMKKSLHDLDSLLKSINQDGLLVRLKLFGSKKTVEEKKQ